MDVIPPAPVYQSSLVISARSGAASSSSGQISHLPLKTPVAHTPGSKLGPASFEFDFSVSIANVLPAEIRDKALEFVTFIRVFKCEDQVYDGTHYSHPQVVAVKYNDNVTRFAFFKWTGELCHFDLKKIMSYPNVVVTDWRFGDYPLPGGTMATKCMCLSIDVQSASLNASWTAEPAKTKENPADKTPVDSGGDQKRKRSGLSALF
jgi:hypothetical protein